MSRHYNQNIIPLFHPRYLKSYFQSSFSEIPSDHLMIIKGWKAKIENGSIYREKETGIRAAFIQKFFVELLGYEMFGGSETASLIEEYHVPSGYIDIALGEFSSTSRKAVVPLELKGSQTKNLDAIMAGRHKSPVGQVWDYANEMPNCNWILLTNYTEIRLYANGRGKQCYQQWFIEELDSPKNYHSFISILSKTGLLEGKTQEILEASDNVEREITDELYRDYTQLRLNLWNHLSQSHKHIDSDELINYIQLILDRILFIAFAEDTALLPAQTLKSAYEHADPYNTKPIWQNFIGLFKAINEGSKSLGIPKYNGGLFAIHPLTKTVNLTDKICEGFKILGDYDFNTEVSINILGHICEQSISDIENLQALARGEETQVKKTGTSGKRKKEGAVYTPAYITSFIVEKTLSQYIDNKYNKLLNEYAKEVPKQKAGQLEADVILWKRGKSAKKFWQRWQDILGQIRIVDPACGSGAFLVAAFDYLNRYYQEAKDGLMASGAAALFAVDKEILSKNLFGVDVNYAAAEITKLSLWLKTAKQGAELNSLDDNIKVGDSIIEDANIEYRSFAWKKDFASIFAEGGFDIVLGNPPYVRQEFLSDKKSYFQKRYEVYTGVADLYVYFFELGLRILKPAGKMGYICSSTFFKTNSGENLREYLAHKSQIDLIMNFGDLQLFEGVTTYPMIMVTSPGEPEKKHQIKIYEPKDLNPKLNKAFDENYKLMSQKQLEGQNWRLEGDTLAALRHKIIKGKKTLKEAYGRPYRGVLTGYNEAFVIDGKTKDDICKADPKSAEIIKPFLEGKDLKRWHARPRDLWLIRIPKFWTKEQSGYGDEGQAKAWMIQNYPALMEYLLPFEKKAKKRSDKGEFWWELRACAYYDEFEKPKVVWSDISKHAPFSVNITSSYLANTAYLHAINDDKEVRVLCALFNHPISWFIWSGISTIARGGYLRLIRQNIEHTVIPKMDNDNKEKLAQLAEETQNTAENRWVVISRIHRRIASLSDDDNVKLSKKLLNFYELSFKDFVREIKSKFKCQLSLIAQDEWEEYLHQAQQKINNFDQKIQNNEAQINQIIYRLFKLDDKEIQLLEESIK